MRLIAYNPPTDNLEKTYLSAAYPVGTSSFVTKNSNMLVANDRIMVGAMGREKTEILTIQSVNADGITVVTTTSSKFAHSADDPVYQLKYDTVRFYRSTTGINGSYSILVSVPVDVDNATLETYYNDNTGLAGYFYEVSYYHSIAAIESALSDPMPGSGYARNQMGTVISELLEEAGDLDLEFTSIPQLLAWANECNDDLSSQSRRPYRFLRKNPYWQLSTTSGNNRISLPTDMTFLDFVKYMYTFGGGTSNPEIDIIDLTEMNYVLSRNQFNVLNDDQLQYIAIDPASLELVLYPTPLTSQTNILTIYGWTSFNEIKSLSSVFQTPNSRIYKLFLLSRYWRRRSIKNAKYQALASAYNQEYNAETVKLQRANKIDKGTPMGMKPDHNRGNLRNDSFLLSI